MKTDEKLVLVVLRSVYIGYYSCLIFLLHFEVIRCTYKISDVKIFKGYYCSHSCHSISTKLYGKYSNERDTGYYDERSAQLKQ